MSVIILVGFFLFRKTSSINSEDGSRHSVVTQQSRKKELNFKPSSQDKREPEFSESLSERQTSVPIRPIKKNGLASEPPSQNLVTYVIDGGVAVTQGDIIIGELDPEAHIQAFSGQVPEPQVRPWPTNEIPYFVQADLPNKERVIEALQMFTGTRVRFIPYNNHRDAIVFERKEGACKSYVGYIGGLQKIYLSDQCGVTEVAHEIMHSLGFVHEQNRSDRDNFIEVFWNNINPAEKVNFEKFSGSAMKITGSSSFDFESIMIYPDTMFSSNQSSTMKAIVEEQKINPSDTLSAKDIERINAIY